MDKASTASATASGSRLLGFFTVLLILTLDASNGKDLIDVLVPFVEAYTRSLG